MALIGLTNDEKIWNYFKNVGMSEYGIAGLIGNIDCESALNPKNLEDMYAAKYGFTDDSYTNAVDSGTYTKFVNDCFGYGLIQVTWWTRKQAMLEYAKSKGVSIGDLEMQIEFIHNELKTSFPSVFSTLMSATSVREASNVVLLKYECPADQSVKVQDYRCSVSQKYYDKLTNKSANVPNVQKTQITTQNVATFVPTVVPVNGYYKIKKGANIKLSEHFSSSEFDCHGSGCCAITLINEKLLKFLEQIRNHFKQPITITSGYRCDAHNRNVRGATGSRHTKGDAVDIVVAGIAPKEVAKYAESIGVKGIGLYETSADGFFVHIDTRDIKSFWYGQACTARSTFGGSVSSNSSTNAASVPNKIANQNYIKYGDTGEIVKELQEKLIKLGCPCGSAGADGYFGQGTKKAVTKFQIKSGFEKKDQDGIVGKKTLDAINAAINKIIPNDHTEYVVTAGALNVRSAPGTNYSIVKVAKRGDIIRITEEKNGWGKTDTGWVSMQYVQRKG